MANISGNLGLRTKDIELTTQTELPTLRHSNNFDGLRLTASLAVLVGHAYVLTGARVAPSIFGIQIDALGVAVFFAISGYLIAKSWLRNPRPWPFFRHRILRIFPALLVVLVITTFIVGPVSSHEAAPAYFGHAQTWQYLGLSAILLAQYHLPGVFIGGMHVTSAVNGSLWTLGVEFSCYCAVAATGFVLRSRAWVGFIFMAAIAITLTVLTDGPWSDKGIADAAPVVVYFAVGAFLAIFPRVVQARAPVFVAVLVMWMAATFVLPQASLVLSWLILPWCVVVFGSGSLPVFRRFARFGDLSYGLYLWAFVVQQTVVDRFGRLPLWADILVVGLVSGGLAWCSWTLIESRALRYKDPETVRQRQDLKTQLPRSQGKTRKLVP